MNDNITNLMINIGLNCVIFNQGVCMLCLPSHFPMLLDLYPVWHRSHVPSPDASQLAQFGAQPGKKSVK